MNLINVNITNFRCFKAYHLDFAPSTTILIGKNGAGKSTVLKAIESVLSMIFAKDKSLGDDILVKGNMNLKVVKFKEFDFFYDPLKGVHSKELDINATGTINGDQATWELYQESSTQYPQFSKYAQAFTELMDEYKTTGELPLIASYSDTFTFEDRAVSDYEASCILEQTMPKVFGYHKNFDEDGMVSVWVNRFVNTYLNLSTEAQQLQKKPDSPEVDGLRDVLKSFSENLKAESDEFVIRGIGHRYIRQKLNTALFFFDNGARMDFSQLPAGYRRLFAIVFDVAYRSFALNGHFDSKGIVLIDEIDSHLHPSISALVVEALQQTFPHIQFIITTHSPLVLIHLNTAKVKDGRKVNKVLLIDKNADTPRAEEVTDVYGLDYNTGLRDVMNVEERSEDVSDLIDQLVQYRTMNDEENYERVHRQLENLLGDGIANADEEVELILKQL